MQRLLLQFTLPNAALIASPCLWIHGQRTYSEPQEERSIHHTYTFRTSFYQLMMHNQWCELLHVHLLLMPGLCCPMYLHVDNRCTGTTQLRGRRLRLISMPGLRTYSIRGHDVLWKGVIKNNFKSYESLNCNKNDLFYIIFQSLHTSFL